MSTVVGPFSSLQLRTNSSFFGGGRGGGAEGGGGGGGGNIKQGPLADAFAAEDPGCCCVSRSGLCLDVKINDYVVELELLVLLGLL